MNTISCPLVVKIAENSEQPNSHDIEASLNSIVYDLEPKVYQVEVKQSSQQEGCRHLQPVKFEFSGKDKEVCK